ncbi:MAG: tripartite tricarboxylate transporter substrate-binding protein, partial [Burkholderiaceae bacterium]
MAGRLQSMLTDLASERQYIDTGKLLALAITDTSRLLPATPTFAEAGYGAIKPFTAFSVLVPATTPPAIVRRLSIEIA